MAPPADNTPMEIGLLKSELDNMKSVLDGVSSKMDTLVTMQTLIVQLQERTSAQAAAIDRAFHSISEARVRADTAVTAINKSMAFVRGAAIVGGLLFAFAQWYALQQIERFDRTADIIAAVDRRLGYVEAKLWPDTYPSEPRKKK